MNETGPYVAGTYLPDEGFIGKDRAEAIVSVGNDAIRVVYYFVVQSKPVDSLNRSEERKFCPKGSWIISGAPVGESEIVVWNGEKSLLAILSGFGEMTFSNLSGAVLAQTTGTGADAEITLDTTAAGHGWFIDATPTYNEEFLPTADPNVWVAKAGSAAEGKMDMLTVLLHEYGHVLGLEHSADGSDAMAATLKPGERRLWSAGDLAALARLGVSYVQMGRVRIAHHSKGSSAARAG